MAIYKNILVPTDFSDNSIQALEFACNIARQNKSNVHIMHVIEPLHQSYRYSDDFYRARHDQSRLLNAEEEMRRFISKICMQGINIVEAFNSGKPCEQILQYSHQKNIDLIVISSHGWTGLSHLVTGNVADKVMRLTDVPTICIKANNLIMQNSTGQFKSTFAENWVG